MAYPTIFANLAAGNQSLALFDAMFNQVAQMVAIPSIASGTNTLVLTPIGNAPSLSNYQNFSSFRFVATATSSASVSAGYQALPSLPVFFSDGITQIGSGAIISGQEYVLIFVQSVNSGAGGFIIENAAIPAAASTGGGSLQNLVITNGATPGTQVAVSYDALDMFTPAGLVQHATGQSFTINTANVGVINGIDAGALGASTFYAIWGIGNGSVAGGLVSASFTAPTMPSGYTYKKRIGAMVTTGASVFNRTLQKQRRAQYVVSAAVTTAYPTIGTTTSATLVSIGTLSNFVPSTATELFLFAASINNDSGAISPNNLTSPTSFTANPSPLMSSSLTANPMSGSILLETMAVFGAISGAGTLTVFAVGWTDSI